MCSLLSSSIIFSIIKLFLRLISLEQTELINIAFLVGIGNIESHEIMAHFIYNLLQRRSK